MRFFGVSSAKKFTTRPFITKSSTKKSKLYFRKLKSTKNYTAEVSFFRKLKNLP